MNDQPKKATHEQLLNGEVNQVSWINEPPDFAVDFVVKDESALEIARRRWRHTELINGDRSERHEA